ncbi:hypothetical protein DPMN_140772 [Dreissena polymorpha]|uniref:Reverse transcriptase domain-containing protein n=1 Tax=Dreissena polymorpha TaxID=45954 RepID=A0A9D4GE47_DREPO|nr:hypothetical protein DPMN_140772 [Dreissena polymorpha]
MVVLDFSKAFDRVPHQRLLFFFSSFLSNRSQHVIVEGAPSDQVPVVSGVP